MTINTPYIFILRPTSQHYVGPTLSRRVFECFWLINWAIQQDETTGDMAYLNGVPTQ